MKITLENTPQDRQNFIEFCRPKILGATMLLDVFKGLRLNNKLVIQNALRNMGTGIEECYAGFCTFTSTYYRFHIEQVGKDVEIEITKL